MLNFTEDFGDLQCEFTGWAQDNGLGLAGTNMLILTQILRNWQSKGQSLAGTSKVTSNHILSVVDGVEAILLDGE